MPDPADPARRRLQHGGFAALPPQQSHHAAVPVAHAEAGFDRMWADLAPLGRHPGTGGYRRFAWTREDADLREWFAGEAAARGLDVVADRAGNLWAWWGDPDARRARRRPGLPPGLGARRRRLRRPARRRVSALAAVDALRARGFRPARPLGVAVLRRRGGRPVRRRLRRLAAAHRGADGRPGPRADRRRRRQHGRGADPRRARPRAPRAATRRRCAGSARSSSCTSSRGGGSADLDRAVAVGTGDLPARPLARRPAGRGQPRGHHPRWPTGDDPMLAFARVVLAARGAAAERHGAARHLRQGARSPRTASTPIPSQVTAWLDARARGAERGAGGRGGGRGRRRGDGGTVTEESWTDRTTVRPAARRPRSPRCSAAGSPAPLLRDRAPDTTPGILAAAGVPTAMLFVRNPTGVSHAPDGARRGRRLPRRRGGARRGRRRPERRPAAVEPP